MKHPTERLRFGGVLLSLAVHPFFDADTCSYSYLLGNPDSGTAAIIDPVLNYDAESNTTSTVVADQIVALAQAHGYEVEWLLETHVHADHLSAAAYLKGRLPHAHSVIGSAITKVQSTLADEYGWSLVADGHQFDRLVADGDQIYLGRLCGRVIATPGHTPACVTYVFDRFAFVGDTVFMPDFGTSRCDFPGGDATMLFQSVQKIYALPDDTRLFMCHDYGPNGRDYRFVTTVLEERAGNIHLNCNTDVDEFVEIRVDRDSRLEMPRLFNPAVHFNIVGGNLDLNGREVAA